MNTISSLLKFIGNQFKRSGISLSGGYISGSWYIYRIGKIVFLQIYNFSSVPQGNFDLGVRIPEGYRPPVTVTFTLTRRHTQAEPMAFSVDSVGNAICYKYGDAIGATTPYNQLLCWFTD